MTKRPERCRSATRRGVTARSKTTKPAQELRLPSNRSHATAAPISAPAMARNERLGEDRDRDRRGAIAKCTQRGDLAGSAGDCGVHDVDGAEQRADADDAAEEVGHGGVELRELAGRLLVEIALPPDVDVERRIGQQCAAQTSRTYRANSSLTIMLPKPVERRLAITVSASPRTWPSMRSPPVSKLPTISHSPSGMMSLSPTSKTLELRLRRGAGDELAGSRAKHAAGNELEFRAARRRPWDRRRGGSCGPGSVRRDA